MKKLTALILAAVLLFTCFTGCGKKNDTSANDLNAEKERPEFTYTSNYTQLSSDDSNVGSFTYLNGKVYFLSYTWAYEEVVDEETGEYRTLDNSVYHINSMSADGSDFNELFEFKPDPVEEGWEGSMSVDRILADADGIWLAEQGYMSRLSLPEGKTAEELGDQIWEYYESKSCYYVVKLSYTGEVIASVDAGAAAQSGEDGENDYFYMSDMKLDSAGNLYIFGGNKILVLNKDGSTLCVIKSEDWFDSAVILKDGTVAVSKREWNENGSVMTMLRVDPAAKKLGEPETLPPILCDRLFAGDGEYDFYYTSGLNYMGLNLETGESTLLFNFINCDVDADYISNLVQAEDGSLLAFSYQYSFSGQSIGMYRIYKVRTEDLPQKTYLTYACMGLDSNVRKEIVKFNRSSDKYRIEVSDYSSYVTDDSGSYENALNMLTTELLTGKIPDMFASSNMPMRQLEAKGYLEDLWPYIEKSYGRDGVVQPLFNALSAADGKLYQITPRFSVQTVAGPSAVVGDKMGWSLQELLGALKKLKPEATIFDMGYTRDQAVMNICSVMIDGFINWNTGEVTFDSPAFVQLLEFANMFPENFDWDTYWKEHQGEDYNETNYFYEGLQLLSVITVSDFINWRSTEMMMGGDLTFVGYPVESGVGSAFIIQSGIAMSATCSDKDGAWEFMSRFLSEDYQLGSSDSGSMNDGLIGYYTYGFPTNKAAFDRLLTQAKTPVYMTDEKGAYVLDENGEKIEQAKGWGYTVYAIEEDVEYEAADEPEEAEESTEAEESAVVEEPAPAPKIAAPNDGAIYHLTDEQAAKILDLIESTTRIYAYDNAIYEIIVDRGSAYFSGQQTAQDAAKAIQSRAFLYVSEQR